MAEKIISLTKEQEALIPVYRERWRKIGLSTDRCKDRLALNQTISDFYVALNQKRPTFFLWFESPAQAQAAANIMKKEGLPKTPEGLNESLLERTKTHNPKGDQYFYSFYFPFESYWISFYDYINKELLPDEKVPGFDELRYINENCGGMIPFDDAVFISEKPIVHHWNGEVLHNDKGKAIEWADGFGWYALNGVRVEEKIVMTPASQIPKDWILKESNAQVRTEIIKKVGIAAILEDLRAKTLDTTDEGYELMLLKHEGREIGPYLKMVNPSTGEIHVEGCGDAEKYEFIDPTITTVEQALAWRNQLERFVKPRTLT